VGVIGGAVEGVHHPGVTVLLGGAAGFLPPQPVGGESLAEEGEHRLLALFVHLRDEVEGVVVLELHLERLAIGPTLDGASGLGGTDGGLEEGGHKDLGRFLGGAIIGRAGENGS